MGECWSYSECAPQGTFTLVVYQASLGYCIFLILEGLCLCVCVHAHILLTHKETEQLSSSAVRTPSSRGLLVCTRSEAWGKSAGQRSGSVRSGYLRPWMFPSVSGKVAPTETERTDTASPPRR